MADYKEGAVAGKSWVRAKEVVIRNEYQETPIIIFKEEEIFVVNGETIKRPYAPSGIPAADSLVAHFDNPNETFDLLNPLTGAAIGTAKNQDLYVLNYSKYQALAKARDIALAAAIV